MAVIEHILENGGSSDFTSNHLGCSDIQTLIRCPFRFNYQVKRKLSNPKWELHMNGMDVGTLCHAFAELYHGGRLTNSSEIKDVTFKGPSFIDELARLEAERISRWYVNNTNVDEFGEVLSVELHTKFDQEDTNAIFGLEMPFKLATKYDVVTMPRPRVVKIVDHKFYASMRRDTFSRLADSVQASVYIEAAKRLFAGIADTIEFDFNVIVKTKEVKRKIFTIPTDLRDSHVNLVGKAAIRALRNVSEDPDTWFKVPLQDCADCWLGQRAICVM